MTTIISKISCNFTQISNYALTDPKISAKACKLYCYMAYRLNCSANWEFHETEILKHFKEGRNALRAAFKELTDQKYLIKAQIRESGKFSRNIYELYEKPLPENRSTVSSSVNTDSPPLPEKPTTVLPTTENRSLNNKEENNKDINLSPLPSNKNLKNKKELEDFWQNLKRENSYNFEIDLDKFYQWQRDEILKYHWKTIFKSWISKKENQVSPFVNIKSKYKPKSPLHYKNESHLKFLIGKYEKDNNKDNLFVKYFYKHKFENNYFIIDKNIDKHLYNYLSENNINIKYE